MDDATRRLLTLCAVRIEGRSLDWSLIARVALAGQLDRLYAGKIPEQTAAARKTLPLLHLALDRLTPATERVEAELQAAEKAGARLVTVLDADYPANLRLVHDLPPFLFVRGTLTEADSRSVAVVGTRKASDDGLKRAARMARGLAERDVTVASGLARGIDTQAHTAALDAGGRTVAVVGTGITRCYPAETADLAERIVEHGAVISQFWPTRPPGRDTFPRRNRVTSGISQGTVVIEASRTSGAKLQARLAHEHGKRVWLLRSLVTGQDWARRMVDEGRAVEVGTTGEVIDMLTTAADVTRAGLDRDPEQLMLDVT